MRLCLAYCLLTFTGALNAAESIDYAALSKIRQEGFTNSKVMETMTTLTEKIGPRLSNSPQMQAANDWTKQQLSDWGMSNARLEAFGPFGRGWEYQSASVNMTAPRQFTFSALPKAWTPGTNGRVEGEAMLLVAKSKEDLEKHKGKLKGKILFISDARELKASDKPDFTRYDEEKLKDLPRSLQENPSKPLLKPAHAKVSVYFNYDNGGGKIRGIYAQENLAAADVFKQWIAPLADLGVSTVTSRNTGSTDHISFDRVGIPGFQFVQDNLDYFSHVHHMHLDGLDHIQAEDLRQSAVVVASLAYLAANRDELLPRKPLNP